MAGITHLKEFSKPALRGLVDESQKSNYEPLSFVEEFVGNDVTYDTNFAYDIIQRNQFIAAMIGLGAEKPVVDRHATAQVMGELAHFGLKDVATVEELYAINQARSDGERNSIIDKLTNRSIDLLEWLQLRVRVEKLKALALGYNHYDKNDVKVKLDYGIPDEHKIVLAGGETWEEKDKDVLGDLLAWSEQYRKTNGQKPEAILITRKVLNKLTDNAVVIAEAGRPDGAIRVSQTEVEEVLERYGLPRIVVVEETTQEVTDIYTGEKEVIEVFPENRVVFASKGAGVFLTGPNPDADNFEPIVVLDAYDERNPRRSTIEVSQSGFAVLENPNLVLHADVLE